MTVRPPDRRGRAWVALSGGVDSAVAAALAIDAGLDVIGVTMTLGVDARIDDTVVRAASAVARSLGIPHRVVDLGGRFSRLVVAPFVEAYRLGRTPNPCIVCNDTVKFGLLLDEALADGAEILVTGHYARIEERDGRPALVRGADPGKDQSYFLYRLVGERLRHLWFPLGGMLKSQVRGTASERGLPSAERSESQDVCFLGGRGVRDFLAAHGVEDAPGEIVDSGGRVLGRHDGVSAFTVGQRKGIGVGGGPALYVTAIDAQTSRVTVGPASACEILEVTAEDIVWDLDVLQTPVLSQVRYRSNPVSGFATVTTGRLTVSLDTPVTGVAPGQSLVCYVDDRVVGGGYLTEA